MRPLESGKIDDVADLKNLVLVLDQYNNFSFIIINTNFQEKIAYMIISISVKIVLPQIFSGISDLTENIRFERFWLPEKMVDKNNLFNT